MAARASGPPGGAQVITTFNGGNVVSTQVPSLNFDGQNAGDLIKTITGVQPNMVSGVTMDNTYIGHQQYRYLPYPVNNRTITWQFTTPQWCHVRDIQMCLQLIFRLPPKGSFTQNNDMGVNFTKQKILNGQYHITNGGLLSIFQNTRIKLGAQVDIYTAFEKTKSAFHLLNCYLRGKWDQKDVFALIDRWDAWYPTVGSKFLNPNRIVTSKDSIPYSSIFTEKDIPCRQSDSPWERLLSRVLAEKGLMSIPLGGTANDFIQTASTAQTQIIENVAFKFPSLHSLFQGNYMLPPGLQFIIEIDLPMYSNFDPNVFESEPAAAKWATIGYIMAERADAKTFPAITSPTPSTTTGGYYDDLQFREITYYNGGTNICVAVNQTSIWNSVVMNCVNMKPEIARSLQDERIKRPLVYNYNQMVATTVGDYMVGQHVYNFTLPPNQAIPTQFIFGWVNLQAYAGPYNSPVSGAGTYRMPSGDVVVDGTGAFTSIQYPWTQLPDRGLNNAALGAQETQIRGPSIQNYSGQLQFNGSSLTPLPVPIKRMIVRRGGFQEVFMYGTYYDNMGNNLSGFIASDTTEAVLKNSCSITGYKNLTPDPSQRYFEHLEEFQWDRKSLNGLGPLERRMKYCYTPAYLADGRWSVIQLNPCKNDTGQYSSDQNAYTVDVSIELDLDQPNIERYTGLNAQSKLVCIRVLPAQLSHALDGTVRIYTWPNLLISPNAVVSGNPPPAGPGGSV